MDAPSIATSSFFRTELDRALGENGFALMAWELRGSLHDDSGRGEAAHAEANVELLPEEDSQGDKGRTVEIQLTLRGYQVSVKQREGRQRAVRAITGASRSWRPKLSATIRQSCTSARLTQFSHVFR